MIIPLLNIDIDRSRVEARQECPRLRFYQYDYLAPDDLTAPNITSGIARESGSLPLLNGTTIHAAHARLLAGWDIEKVITLAREEYTAEVTAKGVFGENDTQGLIREQLAMLEGMVRLWCKWRLPAILEEYELADFGSGPAIEQAWQWQMAPGLRQNIRMDAILRRRDDQLLHILDYKSAGYVSEGWRDKFEHTLQTELYVQALKEKTGEPVGGMLYEGLIKGQYRKDTAQKSPFFGQRIQSTPYCYAYMLAGPTDAEVVWSIPYTAKKGFEKIRITDVMTTKQWVEEHLQYAVKASEMFVVVPPICPPPFELERVKRQVVGQELEYHRQLAVYRQLLIENRDEEARDQLDTFAPQYGGRCVKFGMDYKCPYLESVCWSEGAQPLEEGGFVRRTAHHLGEEEAIAA